MDVLWSRVVITGYMTFETTSKKEIKTLFGEFLCQMRASRISFQKAPSLKLKEWGNKGCVEKNK